VADKIREIRLEQIASLRERGINPYPDRFDRSHSLAEARALGESLGLEAGEDAPEDAEVIRVAGRLIAFRAFGRLSFASLQDVDARLQFALNARVLTKPVCKQFPKDISVGDFVGVHGKLFRTKKGELTVNVESYQLLGKALRPMPEKWAGLKNQELRWRHRYVDLIANADTRKRFKQRSQVVRVMRAMLDDNDFFEVETPILVNKPSGALARPFTSHHNSLDLNVFLRIAPETYLKRLIVGGFDRVYEFARCFRNEGMDPSHLQDFTMLEWYAAYWNYEDNMAFTEKLIQHTIQEVCGQLTVEFGGVTTDFGGTWPRVPLRDMILEGSGVDIFEHDTAEGIRTAMADQGIRLELPAEEVQKLGRGNLIDQLYKKVARPKITNPVFVTQHPADLSPLARRNDDDPSRVDRFQLVVHGWEIVNAYSELVDPIDQRERLEEQSAARDAGDEEAMDVDEEYLLAMEYGMPPISGFGLGVDRFCALLTGQDNLRDVVLFPLLRPLAKSTLEELEADAEAEPDGSTPW
jgi:lysyl-tRNA synthetase class 2